MIAKGLTLCFCIPVLCLSQVALAEDEISETNALGLGWSQCSTTNPVGTPNINFACENETVEGCRTFRMLPTFVSSISRPVGQPVDNAFAGSVTVIDVLIGSAPTVGAWWSGLVPNACRTVPAILTAPHVDADGTCANLYPLSAGTLPYQGQANNIGTNPAPNRYRITSSNSVYPGQELVTGTRYYAMQLEMYTEGTLADCDPATDPTPVCTDGCSAPACFLLNQVSIYMAFDEDPSTRDIIHYSHDGGASRNFCTYQGGTGGNCPGATPTRPATWGAVKALYR